MKPFTRLPEPFRLVAFGSIDSTNDEAKRLAVAGAQGGTLVWACSQSAGRGRRGRPWESEPGNLYASLVLRPECPPRTAVQIGLVASNAIAEAALAFLPGGSKVTCKWPNDVLIEGRKVAGVLLETAPGGGGDVDWLVLGVGVNLEHHPQATEFPATSLCREGVSAAKVEDLLLAVFARFQAGLVVWRCWGFAPARRSWLGRAQGLGEKISVRLESETLEGIFISLDGEGALILGGDGGQRRINAGDVFFPAG